MSLRRWGSQVLWAHPWVSLHSSFQHQCQKQSSMKCLDFSWRQAVGTLVRSAFSHWMIIMIAFVFIHIFHSQQLNVKKRHDRATFAPLELLQKTLISVFDFDALKYKRSRHTHSLTTRSYRFIAYRTLNRYDSQTSTFVAHDLHSMMNGEIILDLRRVK
jgi:hypothetical protein